MSFILEVNHSSPLCMGIVEHICSLQHNRKIMDVKRTEDEVNLSTEVA